MKNPFVQMLLVLALIIGLWRWSLWLRERRDSWKDLPIQYAWYFHAQDSTASYAMASNDSDCVAKIKNYYEQRDKSGDVKVPLCFDFSIKFDVPIRVLEEVDSTTVKIVYFYENRDGIEKHRVGCIPKSTLHQEPFSKR